MLLDSIAEFHSLESTIKPLLVAPLSQEDENVILDEIETLTNKTVEINLFGKRPFDSLEALGKQMHINNKKMLRSCDSLYCEIGKRYTLLKLVREKNKRQLNN